ncbi:nicotinate-nucleotide--dimethylbenzimidazole phosphoribosyltransferase [Paenibacillus oryzae]|nr:nicotinate-nucleotide--dimethylbenzimidazole phosphoribosyltransferase [Paenibacillus oryzae]
MEDKRMDEPLLRRENLLAAIKAIPSFDEAAAARARLHSDRLTKPPGSLGKLEEMAAQLAGMTGELWPDLSRRAVVVMAGDHGVCEEGISAFPQGVTLQMVLNFLNGGAAVNVLARAAGAEVVCVDVGVASPLAHAGLVSRKAVWGTANMTKGPAMSLAETLSALLTGVETAHELANKGVALFATGEMGIGNTTASAAIVSALTGLSPEDTVGRGTGISDEGLLRKRTVVEKALEVNSPDRNDPLDVLSKVGGAEIAGLTGVIIGAASRRCPIVIDGYISTAAALVAARLAPACMPYMIGSHVSQEHGHPALLRELGLSPLLTLDMRLGEGTGAVLCFHLLDAALALMGQMATFDSAGVSGGKE